MVSGFSVYSNTSMNLSTLLTWHFRLFTVLASHYADTIDEIEREGMPTKHKALGAISLESGCEILQPLLDKQSQKWICSLSLSAMSIGWLGYDICVPDKMTRHRKSASKSNQAQQDDALFPIVHRESLHIHLVLEGWVC